MLTCGSLFSGIGLLDYGLHLAGIRHVWLCESDPWRRTILAKRFPDARILDDVRHLGADTAEWVDVIAGGFPCRGISSAGKREGFGHPETVLWREMARAVRELRPRYVVVENVDDILGLHDGAVWGEVLGDLAAGGFDVVWDVFPAAAVGAPHLRQRVIAVATHPARMARPQALPCGGRPGTVAQSGEIERVERLHGDAQAAPDADLARADAYAEAGRSRAAASERTRSIAVDWAEYRPAIERWEAIHGPAPEPLVRRMDDRGASRVERSERAVQRQRLSALGDGVQVQLGRLVGDYLIGLERERLNASTA